MRPDFPDLNVVFPQSDGSVVLSTSHEAPPEFPLITPAPGEEYDRVAGGSVTSLHLGPDLSVLGGAYSAGGMLANCSGSGTPWKTVLTAEEATNALEKPHGFVWEVDVDTHRRIRIDGMGRFDHETAIVHDATGIVYLTQDEGTAHLYRHLPSSQAREFGALAQGGVLQVLSAPAKPAAQGDEIVGTWQNVSDPAGMNVLDDALVFQRLEGGGFDPLHPTGAHLYFTETGDTTNCGALWRLDVGEPDQPTLKLWLRSASPDQICMPENLAVDAAGNLFLCEDKSDAGFTNANRVLFLDPMSGQVNVFAELVHYWQTPDPPGNVADEPTGPAFWTRPDGSSVLFLNLQRAAPTAGVTLAIEGPFAYAGA